MKKKEKIIWMWIGILAGLVGIVAGGLTIYNYFQNQDNGDNDTTSTPAAPATTYTPQTSTVKKAQAIISGGNPAEAAAETQYNLDTYGSPTLFPPAGSGVAAPSTNDYTQY